MATFSKQGYHLTSDALATAKWGLACSKRAATVEKRRAGAIVLREPSRESSGESNSLLSLESSSDEEEEALLKRLRAAEDTSTRRSLRLAAGPVAYAGTIVPEQELESESWVGVAERSPIPAITLVEYRVPFVELPSGGESPSSPFFDLESQAAAAESIGPTVPEPVKIPGVVGSPVRASLELISC